MALQLPVFWEDDVTLWLRFVDNLFQIMNITSDQDKINLVTGALPPNLHTMVSHRLSFLPSPLTYEALQNAVMVCTKADLTNDIEALIPLELIPEEEAM